MTQCESVICCRVSPKEKADVVRLVKQNLGKITLSIGDGANDVNMIQEAHIGVGIYGKEGMNAVQASDYALPEFKALWKLLMVHGRWSYVRISEMILYFFYKNMIFAVPQLVFNFFNGYSGQSIYDDIYISGYNLAFTSMPLIIRALFDKDLYYKRFIVTEDGKTVHFNSNLKFFYPYLYYVGQQSKIFTLRNLLSWIINGIMFGSSMFVTMLFCVDDDPLDSSGVTTDIWAVSISLYTCVVFVNEISKFFIFPNFFKIFPKLLRFFEISIFSHF